VTTQRYAHKDITAQQEAMRKAFDGPAEAARIAPKIAQGKEKGDP
jgi:hypothetical protein